MAGEKPGLRAWPFVKGWISTPAGYVPQITDKWSLVDRASAIGVRLGINRDHYRVSPGLYALGNPHDKSPVIVTSNYKLTFDIIRKEMKKHSCWMLVLETYGINVWCAAGKKSFSTEETARRVKEAQLSRIVSHRTIIIPQLAAPSVAAHKLKGLCGFKGVFGPIRARDLPEFIDNGMTAAPETRVVDFPLSQRLDVAVVEVYGARKFLGWCLLISFILAALGPGGFALQGILWTGLGAFTVVISGFVAGSFVVPCILHRLPARAFAAKGLMAGSAAGLILGITLARSLPEGFAAVAGTAAMSSWFAMHYTGSTPFTSLSGVDREMKIYMPVQGLLIALAVLTWMGWSWLELVRG